MNENNNEHLCDTNAANENRHKKTLPSVFPSYISHHHCYTQNHHHHHHYHHHHHHLLTYRQSPNTTHCSIHNTLIYTNTRTNLLGLYSELDSTAKRHICCAGGIKLAFVIAITAATVAVI